MFIDQSPGLRGSRRAQGLGFTLEEIANLLELDEEQGCAQTRELAAHKLEVFERKLADLKAIARR